jgi:hypothetical protein
MKTIVILTLLLTASLPASSVYVVTEARYGIEKIVKGDNISHKLHLYLRLGNLGAFSRGSLHIFQYVNPKQESVIFKYSHDGKSIIQKLGDLEIEISPENSQDLSEKELLDIPFDVIIDSSLSEKLISFFNRVTTKKASEIDEVIKTSNNLFVELRPFEELIGSLIE